MRFRFPGTLSARIVLGFAVLIVTFGIISANMIFNMDRLDREIRVIRLGYLQLALGARDLAEKQVTVRDYLRNELTGESTAERVRYWIRRYRASREKLLSKMEQVLSDVDPPENHLRNMNRTRLMLEDVRLAVESTQDLYQALLAEPPIERVKDRGSASTVDPARLRAAELALARLRRLESGIANKTRRLEGYQTQRVVGTATGLESASGFLRRLTIVLGAIAVGLGLVVAVLIALSLRPLRRLRAAAQRIAQGDYASRIEERGPKEVADLASEFNVMGRAVEERERELVRTERLAAVGKMAATIAHEVRNPLSSIGLNTELLEEELSELPAEQSEEARGLLRSITTEVDRLAQITETYLNFARLPKPKLQDESLGAIITNLAEFEKEQLAMRGVKLTVSLTPGLPPVPVDENQIRQALLNLLRNAADALEDIGGGTVSVFARPAGGDEVEVEVSDDGPGIAEELAVKLFDPFFSTKEGGTGLGLALTHQIVREHGGHIRVESEPGHGATFLVTLPAVRE